MIISPAIVIDNRLVIIEDFGNNFTYLIEHDSYHMFYTLLYAFGKTIW